MEAATVFEWLGCGFGLLGAGLLALNVRISRWGWWAFLVANVMMIALALLIDRYGLLVQQLGFTATSILGLVRSGFLGKVKPEPKIEFQRILQEVGGGAHKRVDENRELLELLQDKAPEMLRVNPWAMVWIQRNDEVFVEMALLATELELADLFGRRAKFPRPWPGDAGLAWARLSAWPQPSALDRVDLRMYIDWPCRSNLMPPNALKTSAFTCPAKPKTLPSAPASTKTPTPKSSAPPTWPACVRWAALAAPPWPPQKCP